MPESGTTPAPRDRIAAIALSFLKPPTFSGGSWTLAPLDLADALISAFPVLAAEPTTAVTEEQHNIMASRGYDPGRPGEYERFIADGETFEWREQAGSEHKAALAPEPAGVATHNTVSREQIAIEAVLELHKPNRPKAKYTFCECCNSSWPCRTVALLVPTSKDGEK